MMYVNESQMPPVRRPPAASRESKLKDEKLLSLAMTNFIEPSVARLYKVKAPLKSASSVLFCPATSGDLQRSGSLVVADPAAGKIVQFDVLDGRHHCNLASDVEPRGMCLCGPDYLVVVDSNEWGSCIKVISVDTGHVLTTWGRQLDAWTPGAVAIINNGQLIVSNIHPQATSRLTLFTPEGRQVTQSLSILCLL